MDGYVFPKRRYPSTKLHHITLKRSKVATTVRTKPEISQGLRMFENTVAGHANAHRDIIHRFIGVLVRDDLCCCFQQSLMGRDSSIGIATRYGLDGFGLQTLVGAAFSAPVHTGPSFHSMGTGALSRGLDHPPPSQRRG